MSTSGIWVLDPARHSYRTASIVAARLVCMLIAAGASVPAGAADPDQFRARTTADMVALCAADPAEQNYVAAIHFCHGFATGAYQYYLSLAVASVENRFVCPPDPVPSRSQVIAAFVTWARENSRFMPEPPVDSIFRYLAQRYPCGQ